MVPFDGVILELKAVHAKCIYNRIIERIEFIIQYSDIPMERFVYIRFRNGRLNGYDSFTKLII